MQEEEQIMQEKLYEWAAHVQHYPEELKKRILLAQKIVESQIINGTTDSFGISNKTYSRVRIN